KPKREVHLHKIDEDLKKNISKKYGKDIEKVLLGSKDKAVRESALNDLTKEKRPDGRKLDELRNIEAVAGILPRVHGSGLFTRGQTQVMTVATLGLPG